MVPLRSPEAPSSRPPEIIPAIFQDRERRSILLNSLKTCIFEVHPPCSSTGQPRPVSCLEAATRTHSPHLGMPENRALILVDAICASQGPRPSCSPWNTSLRVPFWGHSPSPGSSSPRLLRCYGNSRAFSQLGMRYVVLFMKTVACSGRYGLGRHAAAHPRRAQVSNPGGG